ncbi:unnamed protein product, partial [Ceratitis capitata]
EQDNSLLNLLVDACNDAYEEITTRLLCPATYVDFKPRAVGLKSVELGAGLEKYGIQLILLF